MAAPPTTAIGSPEGIKLDEGFRTVIAFELLPTVSLWELGVKPPGLDGGDPVENTTMRNVAWRTFAARKLKTVTPMTFTAQYDPNVYDDIGDSLLNKNGGITVHFPDLSTLDFWGFIQTFEPDEIVEGTPPTATVTIQPTNFDPANKVEAGPVMTEVAGT